MVIVKVLKILDLGWKSIIAALLVADKENNCRWAFIPSVILI